MSATDTAIATAIAIATTGPITTKPSTTADSSSSLTTNKHRKSTISESTIQHTLDTLHSLLSRPTSTTTPTPNVFSTQSYHNRLQTYTPQSYYGKPLSLSPILCARFGWSVRENKPDLLECRFPGCKGCLYVRFDERLSNESTERLACAYREMLVTNHSELSCPFYADAERWWRGEEEGGDASERRVPFLWRDVSPDFALFDGNEVSVRDLVFREAYKLKCDIKRGLGAFGDGNEDDDAVCLTVSIPQEVLDWILELDLELGEDSLGNGKEIEKDLLEKILLNCFQNISLQAEKDGWSWEDVGSILETSNPESNIDKQENEDAFCKESTLLAAFGWRSTSQQSVCYPTSDETNSLNISNEKEIGEFHVKCNLCLARAKLCFSTFSKTPIHEKAEGNVVEEDLAEEDVAEEDMVEMDEVDEDVAEKDVVDEDAAEEDVVDADVANEGLAEEDLEEEDVTEEDEVDEDLAEEDVVENNMTEENEAKENAAEEDMAEEDMDEEDVVDEDIAEEDVIEEDVAEEDLVDEDVAEEDEGGENGAEEAVEEDVSEEDVVDEDEAEEDMSEEDEVDEDDVDEDIAEVDAGEEDMPEEDIVDEDVTGDDVVEEVESEEGTAEDDVTEEYADEEDDGDVDKNTGTMPRNEYEQEVIVEILSDTKSNEDYDNYQEHEDEDHTGSPMLEKGDNSTLALVHVARANQPGDVGMVMKTTSNTIDGGEKYGMTKDSKDVRSNECEQAAIVEILSDTKSNEDDDDCQTNENENHTRSPMLGKGENSTLEHAHIAPANQDCDVGMVVETTSNLSDGRGQCGILKDNKDVVGRDDGKLRAGEATIWNGKVVEHVSNSEVTEDAILVEAATDHDYNHDVSERSSNIDKDEASDSSDDGFYANKERCDEVEADRKVPKVPFVTNDRPDSFHVDEKVENHGRRKTEPDLKDDDNSSSMIKDAKAGIISYQTKDNYDMELEIANIKNVKGECISCTNVDNSVATKPSDNENSAISPPDPCENSELICNTNTLQEEENKDKAVRLISKDNAKEHTLGYLPKNTLIDQDSSKEQKDNIKPEESIAEMDKGFKEKTENLELKDSDKETEVKIPLSRKRKRKFNMGNYYTILQSDPSSDEDNDKTKSSKDEESYLKPSPSKKRKKNSSKDKTQIELKEFPLQNGSIERATESPEIEVVEAPTGNGGMQNEAESPNQKDLFFMKLKQNIQFDLIRSHRHFCPYATGFANLHKNQIQNDSRKGKMENCNDMTNTTKLSSSAPAWKIILAKLFELRRRQQEQGRNCTIHSEKNARKERSIQTFRSIQKIIRSTMVASKSSIS